MAPPVPRAALAACVALCACAPSDAIVCSSGRIAGTVYATVHEPDDCAGGPIPPGGERAEVEVVSANGQRHVAPVSDGGNFMLDDATVVFPIKATVRFQGRSREMTQPQLTGDCNLCHTTQGTSGAPGRIMLP
jgi:hypothetical protein